MPLILWILCLGLAADTFAFPVEASHPVAGFLKRLEEKGLIHPGFWNTLPRDEREVAAALNQARQQGSRLSSWDRRRLEYFSRQFRSADGNTAGKLSYRDSSFIVNGSVEYYTGIVARDSMPRTDLFAFGSLTPGVEATYREWSYLTASATVGMERSYHPRFVETYDPQRGLPHNVERTGVNDFSGTVSTFDGFRVIVGAGTSDLRLEAGQDWNQWGPGHWQHATLGTRPYFWVSDSLPANPYTGFEGTQYPGYYRRGYRYPGEGPPMPQLRLRFGSSRWEYTKIVAQRTGLWKDSGATLVAHRFQFRAGSWRFGATEMLTMGPRETDWMLLIPAIPLKFAEHSGGNLDNAAMSADVEWIWSGHGRLYGELFMDDFSGPPLDFWGNKFAITVGGSWQDPLGIPAELHVEYARVDPWVYGHHLVSTQMQNYGALLGSGLPPNSHALFASLEFPLPAEITGTAEWQFHQRDYRSSGSSIFDVHDDVRDGYDKPFLAEDVETRNELSLSAAWAWKRYLDLRGGAGWGVVSNWKGNPGVTLSMPSAFGEIRLRY